MADKKAEAKKRSEAAKKAAATRKANAEAEANGNEPNDAQAAEAEQVQRGAESENEGSGTASMAEQLKSLKGHRESVERPSSQEVYDQKQSERDEARKVHNERTGGGEHPVSTERASWG